jgi:hypothetical protein
MADIFLSYAHENHEHARSLAELLTSFGWTVFWDREILAGTVFDDVIQQQLDSAKCVVALWSIHSVGSQWVRSEAEEGANRNMLVSVLVDDVRLPIAFRRIQAAKLLNWTGSKDDEQLKDVLKAIRFVVQKPPDDNSAAPRPVATVSGSSYGAAAALAPSPLPVPAAKTRSPLLVPAIAVGVLVAAGGGWMATRSQAVPAPIVTPETEKAPTAPQDTPRLPENRRETGGAARVVDTPAAPQPTPVKPTPTDAKVGLADDQLLSKAKSLADLLGVGNGDAVRNEFTREFANSGKLTVWHSKRAVNLRGPVEEVGQPTLLRVTDPERKEVQVPIRFANQSFMVTFEFRPDGQITDLRTKPIKQKGAE